MQVSYREIQGGFECIHMPSIELSSVHDEKLSTARRHDNHNHTHFDAPGTIRRGVTKKTSKLSFGRRHKDSDKSVEKDQPAPNPPGPHLTATASSGSSSFFNVSSNAHTIRPDAPSSPIAGGDDKASHSVNNGNDNMQLPSPAKAKTLPPIPRDFGRATTPLSAAQAQHIPVGEVDGSLFESMTANVLCVRFEINIVKVSV